jgi:hypothetical protein
MSLRHAWENLYLGVHVLGVTDAPLKERLGIALRTYLANVRPQDLAEAELRLDFESLYVNAESGKVLRTEWLTDDECRQAAQTILHLFIEVTRAIEHEDFEGWMKNRLLGGQ